MPSEEVCEYVEIFYKIEKLPPGAAAKSYFKKKKRRWCVLSIDISPINCRLVHYDKESSWLKDKDRGGHGENLAELSEVRVLDDRNKSYVLQLEFTYCSLFMKFDSKTKVDIWRQKLNLMLNRYTVQLIKCPEQPSLLGIYVLHLSWTQIDVYYVNTPELAWSWQIPHLRRFNFHANVPDVEVEAGTRSSTGEGHFYFTGVHMRRLFDALKARVSSSSPSKQTCGTLQPAVPPPRNDQMARVRSKSEWVTSPNSEILPFSQPQRKSDGCIRSDSVFQDLPDNQLSPDAKDSIPKDAFGYVEMFPTDVLPEEQDKHYFATEGTHLRRSQSHMHKLTGDSGQDSCISRHFSRPNDKSNIYDVPRACMATYDVPRPTGTVPCNSSNGLEDSDDDLDFVDQWRIEQGLQQCSVQLQSEKCHYQRPLSQVPLQSNPSYAEFKFTQQAKDDLDYIQPSVFKSQLTIT